jgi:hypothetical protein
MIQSENDRKNNEFLPKFGDTFPKWGEVKNLHLKFKNKQKYSLNHLLVALYTLQIPRRLEYFTIIYYESEQKWRPSLKPKNRKQDIDEKQRPYNFIYPVKNNLYKMVLGNYKTDDKYKIFETILSKELSDVIKGYVDKNNIKDGNLLIVNSIRNIFKTSAERSKVLSRAFDKVYEFPKTDDDKKHSLTLDDLRHIYTTSLHNNEFKEQLDGWDEPIFYKEMTSNQKEQIGYYMGHSMVMNESYRKIKASKNAAKVIEPPPQEDNNEAEPMDISIENSTENETCEMCENMDVDMKQLLEAKLKYYEMEVLYIKKQLQKLSA